MTTTGDPPAPEATPSDDPTVVVEATAPDADAGDAAIANIAAPDATQRGGRLEFLDALRGLAAFAVMAGHIAESFWEPYVRFSTSIFRPGEWGVIVFFLTSGFIIPASLERHRSTGRFWVGRVFRLFPLYLACVFAALLLHHFAKYPLPDASWTTPRRSVAWNTTMLQHFAAQPLLLGNSWTLAYEMVFYFFMSMLLLANRHKDSVRLATVGLLAALAVGTFVPETYLKGIDLAGFVPVLAVAVGVVGYYLRTTPATPGARAQVIVLGAAVVLFVANRPEPLWFALLLFSSMFVGTVLYRYVHGDVPKRTATYVVLGALLAIWVAFFAYQYPFTEPATGATVNWRGETLTFFAAYGAFVGGLALRHLRFPRPLTYLGAISYSVYLVHAVVLGWLFTTPSLREHPAPLVFTAFVVISLLASVATYHGIEKPFQQWGRTLVKRRTWSSTPAAPGG